MEMVNLNSGCSYLITAVRIIKFIYSEKATKYMNFNTMHNIWIAICRHCLNSDDQKHEPVKTEKSKQTVW